MHTQLKATHTQTHLWLLSSSSDGVPHSLAHVGAEVNVEITNVFISDERNFPWREVYTSGQPSLWTGEPGDVWSTFSRVMAASVCVRGPEGGVVTQRYVRPRE